MTLFKTGTRRRRLPVRRSTIGPIERRVERLPHRVGDPEHRPGEIGRHDARGRARAARHAPRRVSGYFRRVPPDDGRPRRATRPCERPPRPGSPASHRPASHSPAATRRTPPRTPSRSPSPGGTRTRVCDRSQRLPIPPRGAWAPPSPSPSLFPSPPLPRPASPNTSTAVSGGVDASLFANGPNHPAAPLRPRTRSVTAKADADLRLGRRQTPPRPRPAIAKHRARVSSQISPQPTASCRTASRAGPTPRSPARTRRRRTPTSRARPVPPSLRSQPTTPNRRDIVASRVDDVVVRDGPVVERGTSARARAPPRAETHPTRGSSHRTCGALLYANSRASAGRRYSSSKLRNSGCVVASPVSATSASLARVGRVHHRVVHVSGDERLEVFAAVPREGAIPSRRRRGARVAARQSAPGVVNAATMYPTPLSHSAAEQVTRSRCDVGIRCPRRGSGAREACGTAVEPGGVDPNTR